MLKGRKLRKVKVKGSRRFHRDNEGVLYYIIHKINPVRYVQITYTS